jgi:hypothetical protein
MDTIRTTMMAGSMVRSIPRDALPASAGVDVLHLSANLKSAFRSRLATPNLCSVVEQWCEQHGLAFQVDQDGFVCVARTNVLAARLLEVDRSPEPHERTLGLLLGYPSCCCEYVANVGESNIDKLAEQMREWRFLGEYRLIDPTGYLRGSSLICHLPCSPCCTVSLTIARLALRFLNEHRHEPGFERWSNWLCENGGGPHTLLLT